MPILKARNIQVDIMLRQFDLFPSYIFGVHFAFDHFQLKTKLKCHLRQGLKGPAVLYIGFRLECKIVQKMIPYVLVYSRSFPTV